MADWPDTLPQHPLRDGFSRAPQPNIISFGTEVGEGKRRRRSTARLQSWTLSFMMTAAEVAIFELFYQDDLGDGVLPFDWVYPMTGATWRFWFDVQQPYGISIATGIEYRVDLSLDGRIVAYA
jgi:hypothetical protein